MNTELFEIWKPIKNELNKDGYVSRAYLFEKFEPIFNNMKVVEEILDG